MSCITLSPPEYSFAEDSDAAITKPPLLSFALT